MLVQKIQALIVYFQTQIADLQQQLATALANDAADAEAIASAQAAATQAATDRDVAIARAEELQAQVNTDAAEEAEATNLIDSILPPAPTEEPTA